MAVGEIQLRERAAEPLRRNVVRAGGYISMPEPTETHTLVVGASDHRHECVVRAPADAAEAGRAATGRHGSGGAERERVHEKRTSGE